MNELALLQLIAYYKRNSYNMNTSIVTENCKNQQVLTVFEANIFLLSSFVFQEKNVSSKGRKHTYTDKIKMFISFAASKESRT